MKKGARQSEKHKPNTRHTLNEVLHSLQDMMHNELADIELPPEANAANPQGKPRSKEDALNHLKALIGSQAPEPVATNDTIIKDEIDVELASDVTDEDAGVTESDDAIDIEVDEVSTDEFIHAGELSNPADFSDEDDDSLDQDESDGSIDAPDTPSAEDFTLEMEDADKPAPPPDSQKAKSAPPKPHTTGSSKAPTVAAKQVEINWDDIPVLNDVVAPPPTPDDVTSRQAREIAIKVAAALNIELKKEGTGTMDIKTIMRLQSLLGRELAEHGGNLDEEQPDDAEPDAKDSDA
jgi:hypothetical protein